MYGLMSHITQYPHLQSCYRFGEYLHVSMIHDNEATLPKLLEFLQTRGITGVTANAIAATVEDCFIKLLKE
jgi:hypothetical protein